MKVYLGSDHRGYKLKEEVFGWLVEKGYKVEDFGAYEFDKKDDYTLYAEKVASVIGRATFAKASASRRGILFCGSGVGVDIVANKFDGVRASLGKSVAQVKAGRADDDMNVLVMAADFTSTQDAKEMVGVFLRTKFSGKRRHKRRLSEIAKIEANN